MDNELEKDSEIIIDNDESEVQNSSDSDEFIVEEEEVIPDVVKKLREKLRKCEAEKKEYLDGWQRCKAEFVNIRKRDGDQRIASVKLAKEDILINILPVLDSFEVAFSHSDSDTNIDQNWITGMKNVQTQLLNILKEYGIAELNPLGEEFSPTEHDSVEMVKSDSKKDDGKIVKVLQLGYSIDGKVIRPAKVCVAHSN